jgi:hypothetical protein
MNNKNFLLLNNHTSMTSMTSLYNSYDLDLYNKKESIKTYDEKQESIKAYKGELYGDINSSLRESSGDLDKIDPQIRKHIENIDSSMKEGEKDKYLVLYRGISNLRNFLRFNNSIDSSPRIIDLAFSSATKNIKVTKSFVDMNGCCVLAFVVPSEIKRYVYGDQLGEDEVLLQRNLQFILESDEPKIDSSNKLQIYKAIVKPYDPPQITKKDFEMLEKLEQEIEEKLDIEEIYQELKDLSFDSNITEEDIDVYIEDNKHWSESKKKRIKDALLEMIKNDEE